MAWGPDLISQWQSVWPNRAGRIGQVQAIQWLAICLLLTVFIATYFRLSLQVVYKVMLLKGFDGPKFHLSAALVTVLLYWQLKRFFQRCLHLPCHAVTFETLPQKEDSSWKLLVGLNSVCVLMPGFSIIYSLLLGKHNLSGTEWGRLLLLIVIGVYSFRLAVGATLTSPLQLPDGKAGSFSELVVGVAVWSNAAFLLSSSIYMPYHATAEYWPAAIQHAGYGTLVAFTLWQLKGVKWPVLLGLVASIAGGPFLGLLLARAVALSGVFVTDYWVERNWKLALIRTWGFGIGLACGRIVGGALGWIYLGVEGGEIGATIGEALAATLGFQMALGLAPSSQEPRDEP